MTCFLGGIFFFLGADAYVRAEVKKRKNLVGRVQERKEAENWLAVLAAGGYKVGINEEKEKVRGLVGGVMK